MMMMMMAHLSTSFIDIIESYLCSNKHLHYFFSIQSAQILMKCSPFLLQIQCIFHKLYNSAMYFPFPGKTDAVNRFFLTKNHPIISRRNGIKIAVPIVYYKS